MSPRPKPPTENALLDALATYGRAIPKRPAGDRWQTLEEAAKEESERTKILVTVPALKYRMKMAQARGIVFETATGSAADDDGKCKRAIYYRLRNGKP